MIASSQGTLAEHAVVTGGLALLLGVFRFSQIVAGIGNEVAKLHCRPRDPGPCGRGFYQLARHAGPAFGRFMDSQVSSATRGLPRKVRLTVLLETPAAFATSAIVGCRMAQGWQGSRRRPAGNMTVI